MTKTDFFQLLECHNISRSIVIFDDLIKDGYCVRHNNYRWEVFFRERGKEFDCIGFPSESDALQYLFEKLRDVYVKDIDDK